jgi:hypothetical protein
MHEADMGMEAGIPTAISIGIIGGGILTAWCLWSRREELKDRKTAKPAGGRPKLKRNR